MKPATILAIFGICALLVMAAGCTTDNYQNSHEKLSEVNLEGCNPYYETITIIDKTTEIVPAGFASRTSYIIVADDGLEREAESYAVYRQLERNNTYTIISTDRKGCGYSYHHIWIRGVNDVK